MLTAEELDGLETLIPGIAAVATDVVGADGSHPQKAGPCASCQGLDEFSRLRSRLDRLPDRVDAGEGPRG